ncbi:MAG: PQQ-binding-like beta-propeller repeat protein [Candidatus Pacebacteria bacterium]|nr:PQQ-binding-like beta-propeller repeat protein [Candidatus Paceibacterota bacterium]
MAESPESNVPMCDRHSTTPATMQCARCGKPICRECVEMFGYFCGERCLQEARQSVSPEEKRDREREEQEMAKLRSYLRRGAAAFAILLLVLAGGLVWRGFIAAPGKVVWSWPCPENASDLHVAIVPSGHLSVMTGQSLVMLDSHSGEQIRRIELPRSFSPAASHVGALDGDWIVHDTNGLARVTGEGKPVFAMAFDRSASVVETAESAELAWILLPADWQWGASVEQVPSKVVCVSLKDGHKEWTYTSPQGSKVSTITANSGCIVAQEIRGTGTEATYFMYVLDAASGKPRWEVSFPEEPSWGPLAAGKHLLVQSQGILHAFSEAGQEVWSLEVEKAFAPSHFTVGDMLFVSGQTGSACYDVDTGQLKWTTTVMLNDRFVYREDSRLIVSGYGGGKEDKGASFNGPAQHQLDELLKDMGRQSGINASLLTADPIVVCLDPDTGEAAWRTRKLLGDVLTDGTRLVHVMDTSVTGVLTMISGGKGTTVIEQFNCDNGESMYRKHSDIGFMPVGVSGGRLVGLTYVRRERPGVSTTASRETLAEYLKGPRTTGVAGLRLR